MAYQEDAIARRVRADVGLPEEGICDACQFPRRKIAARVGVQLTVDHDDAPVRPFADAFHELNPRIAGTVGDVKQQRPD